MRVQSTRLREGFVEAALIATPLVAFVLAVAPTLDQPLLEAHAFRQTETAFTARVFHEQGIDLLNPKLPVLGEPFEVPFEFPLFQAAASIVMDTGVPDDVAMRLTGLVCFIVTALLLYGLVRHVDGRASALSALVAFVATPFALVWGRASMIEYLATAGAVGFAWGTVAWRQNRRPAVCGLALAAGLVGMLVKPTTAVFWVIPALAYRPTGQTDRRRLGAVLGLTILVLVPLAAALMWTRHADAIKAASPTTDWLTSSALREWTFGTLSQRLEGGVIVVRLVNSLLWLGGLVLVTVGVIAAVRSAQRLFWLGIGLTAVLPPLVFANLYLVHDYYLAALTPAVAALVGLGTGHVWRRLPQERLVLGIAAVVGLLVVSSTLVLGHNYWRLVAADDPSPRTLELAREVQSHTRPNDRVGVAGLDWSPAVLYYANRWGLMVVEGDERVAYDAMHADDYRYLLVGNPLDVDLRPLARWRWLGSLGPHSYAIADDVAKLGTSQFVSTDDPGAVDLRGRALTRAARVPCGTPMRLRSGRNGTLIRISSPSRSGRVSVSDQLAPLPTRSAMFVGPRVARAGFLTLECSGQRALLVHTFDVPLPHES